MSLAGPAGTITTTGAGAACACASLSAVTIVPASTTPPFATPDCTGRVSVTELTTVPVGRISSAFAATVFETLVGESRVLKRPPSVAGTVTMTRPPRSWTEEPGMKRTASPLRVPATRPDPSTMTAVVDSSKSKVSFAISVDFGADGAFCDATVVIWPARTATVWLAPVTVTTPSVVWMSVPWAVTVTWNAVPCTVASAVAVMTSYFAVAGSG